jgi:uncharacterized membrane protein
MEVSDLTRIEESIEINAPQRGIWPMIRWDRVPEWMDMIKKVEYTSEQKETVGATAHWIGEAGGVKSEWDTETTEWEVNERGAWRSTRGTFTGIGSITLTPSEYGTKATFMMDYDLPYSILGKIIDKLRVCKAVEKGITRALKKLKELVEAGNQGKSRSKLQDITIGEGAG